MATVTIAHSECGRADCSGLSSEVIVRVYPRTGGTSKSFFITIFNSLDSAQKYWIGYILQSFSWFEYRPPKRRLTVTATRDIFHEIELPFLRNPAIWSCFMISAISCHFPIVNRFLHVENNLEICITTFFMRLWVRAKPSLWRIIIRLPTYFYRLSRPILSPFFHS